MATGSLEPLSAWLKPGWPHLTSPMPREVWAKELAQGGNPQARSPEAVIYSEFNHHWAGVFVLVMGVLSFLDSFKSHRLAWTRIWPLALVGLSISLFFSQRSGSLAVGTDRILGEL